MYWLLFFWGDVYENRNMCRVLLLAFSDSLSLSHKMEGWLWLAWLHWILSLSFLSFICRYWEWFQVSLLTFCVFRKKIQVVSPFLYYCSLTTLWLLFGMRSMLFPYAALCAHYARSVWFLPGMHAGLVYGRQGSKAFFPGIGDPYITSQTSIFSLFSLTKLWA